MRASQPVSSNIDSDAASNADNSISADNRGTRVVDTQAYTASEIDRVTRVALDQSHKMSAVFSLPSCDQITQIGLLKM